MSSQIDTFNARLIDEESEFGAFPEFAELVKPISGLVSDTLSRLVLAAHEFSVFRCDELLADSAVYLSSCMAMRDEANRLETALVKYIIERRRYLDNYAKEIGRLDAEIESVGEIGTSVANQTALEVSNEMVAPTAESGLRAQQMELHRLRSMKESAELMHDAAERLHQRSLIPGSALHLPDRYDTIKRSFIADLERMYSRLVVADAGLRSVLGIDLPPLPDIESPRYIDEVYLWVGEAAASLDRQEQDSEVYTISVPLPYASAGKQNRIISAQQWNAFKGETDSGGGRVAFTLDESFFENCEGQARILGLTVRTAYDADDVHQKSNHSSFNITLVPPRQEASPNPGAEPMVPVGGVSTQPSEFVGRTIRNFNPVGEWTLEVPDWGGSVPRAELDRLTIDIRVISRIKHD